VADREFILTGERAALGMLKRENLPSLASWFNDPRDAVLARGVRHDSILMDAVPG